MRKRGRPPKDQKPTDVALNSGPTEEDLELERRLNAIDAEEIVTAPNIDPEPLETRAKIRVKNTLTCLQIEKPEIKPADKLSQLRDQVFMAKQYGCDSIEVNQEIMRTFLKQNYPPKSGYFTYDSVRVYETGTFEKMKDYDFKSVNERVFGKDWAK